MEEWKEYKAIDFCKAVTDGTHDSPKPQEKGHYLITSKHLKESGIDFSSANLISEEDYIKVISRSEVEQYDILYSMIGTIGNIVQVKAEKVDFAVKNMGIFKMGKNYLHSLWLFYWLKSSFALEYVSQRLAGSTQSYLTLKTLRDFPILYPGDSKATDIVSILKSLDDKIEVNKRINENLEQQAQALFKSWFVDFEPFKNGEFVESELGMIPKGWRVVELEEIADISKISINPQKHPQVSYKHYSIPSFDDGMNPEVQLGEDIKSSKFVITNKMVLFSKLNPRIKRVWFVDKLDTNSICSTEFVPYKAKEESKSSFLYCLINSQGFYDFVMSMVNGATGSHQRFHPDDSLKFRISIKDECISKYCDVVTPMINQILDNREESLRLASLRDTLLPKLMSGEIKVNEINNL